MHEAADYWSSCPHILTRSFSNGHPSGQTDSHWLSSLERVESPHVPPSASSPSTPSVASPRVPAAIPARPPSSVGAGHIASPRPVVAGPTSPLALSSASSKEVEDLRDEIENNARTIFQLEEEKRSLTDAAERLKQVEIRMYSGHICVENHLGVNTSTL